PDPRRGRERERSPACGRRGAARNAARHARGAPGDPPRCPGARASRGARHALGATLRPGGRGLRVRLDAASGRKAAARACRRFRPVRPRRLGRAQRRHRRDRGAKGLRHPRLYRCVPALAGGGGLRGRHRGDGVPGRGRGRDGGGDACRGHGMKRFAALFAALDGTTATNAKVAALADYFRTAPDEDRLWTIALLSGRRPRRSVTTTELREWAAEAAGLPLWLFEESYPVVGDLAETIALVLPEPRDTSDRTLADWIGLIRAQSGRPSAERKAAILDAWARLAPEERFLFNKLITGGFRMGVSQRLMTRALARATGMDEAEPAHRLMGAWTPETVSYRALLQANDRAGDLTRPYPFFLAHPLEDGPEGLGDPAGWSAEWKWDGIRGQLVFRRGALALWSRGEELITDRFPE